MLPFGHKYVAMHGAVYGTNFGDVVIQTLLAEEIRAAIGFRAWFPYGTKDWGAAIGMPTGGKWCLKRPATAIFGPGGYFGERPFARLDWDNRLLSFHGDFFRLIRRKGLNHMIFGVGVGPLSSRTSRELVTEILRTAERITVRDIESKTHAEEWGIQPESIRVCPDIAMLLTPNRVRSASPFKPSERLPTHLYEKTIGLHLPNIADDETKGYEALCRDIDNLVRANPNWLFVFMGDARSDASLIRMRSHCNDDRHAVFVDYSEPDERLAMISLMDAVVTTKLHVGICAAALGVPPVAVYRHDKVARFFAQLGHSEYATSLDSYPPRWICDQVNRVLSFDRQEFSATVEELRSAVRFELDLMLEHMRALIGKRC